MPTTLDNPAGRLLDILQHLRVSRGTVGKRLEDLLSQDSASDLFAGLALLVEARRLPAETVRVATQILPDVLPEALEDLLADSEQALAAAIQGYRRETAIRVRATTLSRLEDLSHRLHMRGVERGVNLDSIAVVEKQLHELLRITKEDSTLDAQLCAFIVKHTEILLKGVLNVRIHGIGALMDALDQTVGSAVRHGALVQPDRDDAKQLPGKHRFWEVVQRVANVAQIASLPLAIGATVGSPEAPRYPVDGRPAVVVHVDMPQDLPGKSPKAQ